MCGNHVLFSNPVCEIAVEHLYTVEDYCTFKIKVKSSGFTGASTFCISKEKLTDLIERCSKMAETLKGQCEIRDHDSDAYVTLEMDRLGQVQVFGQIGGTHEDHTLRFRNTIDQTAVVHLVELFKALH